MPAPNQIVFFDTTLRDGEQSPGCTMHHAEKLRMAHKLAELGVDVMEAGFPIASEGDFEAVDAVSREFPWMQVAALARSCTMDVERAAQSLDRAAARLAARPKRAPPGTTALPSRSSNIEPKKSSTCA